MSAPVMGGVYADPSQLSADVDQTNSPIFNTYQPSLKDQIALQRAQASMTNPYYRAMLTAQNQRPQYDTSNSANWGQGIAQGVGNISQAMFYNQRRKADNQILQNWQQQEQQAQQQQAAAQQAAQQRQAQIVPVIQQRFGPDAALAYQLDPGNYSKSFATHTGELPTVQPTAYSHAYGESTGKNAANQANVTSNQQFLGQQGVTPGLENTAQLTPQAMNLIKLVTGNEPQDLLSFKQRQAELQGKQLGNQSSAQSNAVQPTLDQQKIAANTLDLQGKAVSNEIARLEAQYKPILSQQTIDRGNLDITDKTQKLADAEAVKQLYKDVTDQMALGKQLSPSDAAALDARLKALGVTSNFVGTLKAVQNPKAGQKLKEQAGPNGFVQLKSGALYNPATKQIVAPQPQAQQPIPSKPASNLQAKPLTQYLPTNRVPAQLMAAPGREGPPNSMPVGTQTYDNPLTDAGANVARSLLAVPGQIWNAPGVTAWRNYLGQ